MIDLPQTFNLTQYWTLVNMILHQYFSNTTVFVFYGDRSPDEFLSQANVSTAYIVFNGQHIVYPQQPDLKAAKVHHFVFIHDVEFENKLLELRRNYAWNPRGRVLVLTTGGDSTVGRRIIEELWRTTRASNMAVVVTSHGYPKIITWQPRGPHECEKVLTIQERTVEELYKKEIDLRKCLLRVQTTSVSPYVLHDTNGQGEYTEGIEMKAIYAIAEAHSMPIVFIPRPKGESIWNMYDKNYSLVGPMARLDNYEIDIAFSCFAISSNRFYLAEILQPHTDEDIVWIVPIPKPILQSINIFSAFNMSLSFIMAALLVLITILYHSYDTNLNWGDSIILSFNTLIYYPVQEVRRGNFITILVYVFSMHLITAYQSSLLILLVKSPTEKPIESIDEGVDAGLHFSLLPSLKHVYNNSEKGWSSLFKANRFIYTESMDPLKEAALNRTHMVLMGRNIINYFIGLYKLVDENGQKQVKFLNGRFIGLPIAMFMYTGHPMQPKFFITSMKLHESGLLEYWRSNYLSESTIYAPAKSEVTVIGWKNVQGVFITWLITALASFLAFVIELASTTVLRPIQPKNLTLRRLSLVTQRLKNQKPRYHSKRPAL